MITFGYNTRFSAPLRALLFIAVGALMIWAKADAMELVVKIVAAFMLAAGLVSFVVGYKRKSDGIMPLASFNALTNMVIAVLLLLFAGFVARFISYLIGIVLVSFGVFQLMVLSSVRKDVKVGFYAYLLPLLVLLSGLFIFFYPGLLGQSIGLFAGIAMILYGISELIAAFKVKSAMEPDDITVVDESQDADEQ